MGFSVSDASGMGNGFPDLVIGRNGLDALVEIKTDDPKSHYGLRPGQKAFALEWRGAKVIVARTSEEILHTFNLRIRKVC
jgi:hypothetical protein